MAIHRISPKLGRLSICAAGLMAIAVGWLLLTAGPASAQPGVAWSLTLGGSGDDFAHAVIETSDGGFLVAGETGSSGAGGQDVWLVKLGSEGGREWDRTFGGPEDDVGYDVQQTDDGGYIIAAETHSFGARSAAKSDYWLIKTDSMGNMEWQRTFGNLELPGSLDFATNDVPQTVKQTADLGYIIAGSTRDRRQEDVWLVKTDSSGEPEWSSQLGGRGDDRAYEILQTGDGGFVAAGKTESFGAGGSDFWLVKTGPSGETEWARTYGGEIQRRGPRTRGDPRRRVRPGRLQLVLRRGALRLLAGEDRRRRRPEVGQDFRRRTQGCRPTGWNRPLTEACCWPAGPSRSPAETVYGSSRPIFSATVAGRRPTEALRGPARWYGQTEAAT